MNPLGFKIEGVDLTEKHIGYKVTHEILVENGE